MRNLQKLAFILTLICFFFGCSSGMHILPNTEHSNLSRVAVMLVANPSIPEERAKTVEAALRAALELRGYRLLEPALVRARCSSVSCPEQHAIFEDEQVDGIVLAQIDSISRNNFLAAYYSVISGSIRLIDPTGAEVSSFQASESERGGILFNSGQVLEGLKSQFENFSNNAFDLLAERFADSVAKKLPQPTQALADVAPPITNVALTEKEPLTYSLCVDSGPGNVATLIVGHRHTPLRAQVPGKYCGVFRVDSSFEPDNKIIAEVRSPFGEASRQEVHVPGLNTCPLGDSLALVTSNGSVHIRRPCSGEHSDMISSQMSSSCFEEIPKCTGYEFVVYESPKNTGPYRRIGTLKSSGMALPAQILGKEGFYQVVSVNQMGAVSRPTSATLHSNSNVR